MAACSRLPRRTRRRPLFRWRCARDLEICSARVRCSPPGSSGCRADRTTTGPPERPRVRSPARLAPETLPARLPRGSLRHSYRYPHPLVAGDGRLPRRVKIAEFEIIHLRGPELAAPLRPAWAPGTSWQRRDAVLVKLTTDDGLVGWGTPGYAGSPLLESWIKPQLIGAHP